MAEAVVGGVEAAGRGPAAGTHRGLRSEGGGPGVGWGTAPSAPASARWSMWAGSWGPVPEGAEAVEEAEEKLVRWSAVQVGEPAAEG